MRAREQQVGCQDAAGLVFPLICSTPVLFRMTRQSLNLLRTLFLSLSLLCLIDTGRQKNTCLTVQQWGQGLCPTQPVCSCSTVFYSTGLHKQTGHEQLPAAFEMDSKDVPRIFFHMQSHTNTHTCTVVGIASIFCISVCISSSDIFAD